MCVCARAFFGWNKCSHHVNYIRWKYLNSPCWARGQTWRWCDHLDNLGRWDLAVSHSFTVKKATKSEASVVILGRRRLSDFQQGSRIKKCEKAQLVKPHILSVPSHPVCGRVRTIRWLDHCSPTVHFMWFHLIGYHDVWLCSFTFVHPIQCIFFWVCLSISCDIMYSTLCISYVFVYTIRHVHTLISGYTNYHSPPYVYH